MLVLASAVPASPLVIPAVGLRLSRFTGQALSSCVSLRQYQQQGIALARSVNASL